MPRGGIGRSIIACANDQSTPTDSSSDDRNASGRDQINKEAWEAFLEMRTQAAAAGVQDLTLDEINAEIQNARNER